MAEKENLDELPIEISQFTSIDDIEIFKGRYQVVIQFVTEDDNKDAAQPIGDMFLYFEKPIDQATGKKTIMHTAIKNGVLNILNSLATVKGFHTYSDYLVLLGLSDGIEKVISQLETTFTFGLKSVTEKEYLADLEKKKAEAERLEKELDKAEESSNILEEGLESKESDDKESDDKESDDKESDD